MSLEEEIAELKAKNAALEELVRAQLELIEELRANKRFTRFSTLSLSTFTRLSQDTLTT